MKLLFIIHSSESSGGAEDDIERVLSYFSDRGNEIHIICPKGPRLPRYSSYAVSVSYYTWGFLPLINNKVSGLIRYLGKGVIQYFQIKRLIKGCEYDLVYFNVSVLLAPLVAAKVCGNKCVVAIKEHISPPWLRKWVYRFLSRYGDYFISVSNSVGHEFESCTNNHNVSTIYSAIEKNVIPTVDTKIIENLLFEHRVQLVPGFRFCVVGPLSEIKNQLLVLKAMVYIKKTNESKVPYVFFAGHYIEGSAYLNMIRTFIKSNGLENRCILLGMTSKMETLSLIKFSDSLIISSLNEGLPLVLIEALGLRTPVISTKVGGIPEVITNGINGILIDSDFKELAAKMLLLQEDKSYAKKLTENGFELFESKFDLATNLTMLEQIFECLSYKSSAIN